MAKKVRFLWAQRKPKMYIKNYTVRALYNENYDISRLGLSTEEIYT